MLRLPVKKSILSLLVSFVIISAVSCQLGFFVYGVRPYFLYQHTEASQGLKPDIRLQMDSPAEEDHDLSFHLTFFDENMTRPTKDLSPYVEREMTGIYTLSGMATIGGDGQPGILMGLDATTLEKLGSLLEEGQLPGNDASILLIQDRKNNSYYHTDFKLHGELGIRMPSRIENSTTGRNFTVSGILELDFPVTHGTSEPLHVFPQLIPGDIFNVKGMGILLVTSLEYFNSIFDDLQKTVDISYAQFKHVWLDRSKIDYNRVKSIFKVVNDYVHTASLQWGFYYGYITGAGDFYFKSDILSSLNAASAGFDLFLWVAVIFGLPAVLVTFLLSGFLMQVYERENVKKSRLLELRGYPRYSITWNVLRDLLLSAVTGSVAGIVLGMLLVVIYTWFQGAIAGSFSFSQFKLGWNDLLPLFAVCIAMCLLLTVYRLVISLVQTQEDVAVQKDGKKDNLDMYLFFTGLFSVMADYLYQAFIPAALAAVDWVITIYQVIHLLGLTGFFGILLGSPGIIRRIIHFTANALSRLPKQYRSVFTYQVIIAMRQRKQYIRLTQVITLLVLFIQVLIVFNGSVHDMEVAKALTGTGAEGYVNSPVIPPDVREYFHISANTSIVKVTIYFLEGYFTVLGIDPDSYFEIAHGTASFPEESVNLLKTSENGVFYHESLAGMVTDSHLSLHYRNKSLSSAEVRLYTIRSFEAMPRLREAPPFSRYEAELGPTNLFVMKHSDLQDLLARMHVGAIEKLEEGSLVTISEPLPDQTGNVREFQGYRLNYYEDHVNSLFLDLLSAETLYFLINGIFITMISLTSIFYFLVSFREKELSLEQVLGLSRTKQFLAIETSGIMLLSTCLLFGTATAVPAAASLVMLYQLVEPAAVPVVSVSVENLVLVPAAFLILSLLGFPLRSGMYRVKDLFQTIRRM